MKLRLAKTEAVDELKTGIEKHLDAYRSGDFADFFSPQRVIELESREYEPADLESLVIAEKNVTDFDAENAAIAFSALDALSPYLAKDERLWTYLCHADCLNYTRSRWKIPKDDGEAVKFIKRHWFAQGDRGFKRNNAVGRLWWDGFIASKYKGASLQKTLEVLLHQTDVRAQVLERPTTSNGEAVFSAVMRLLIKKFDDGELDFSDARIMTDLIGA